MLTGVAHTIRTTIEEDPRKFKIDVGFNTDFNNQIDVEYYFNPVESVGVGTTAESWNWNNCNNFKSLVTLVKCSYH